MDLSQRQEVAQEILAAREARGWSAATLAKKAGISPTTMTKVSNAESVHPGTIAKLREALGIEPLTVVAAKEGYPPDIALVQEVVGMWLLRAPESERPAMVRDFIACIVTNRPSVVAAQAV
jgi:transcriptional regulator with XRE-family HTH domain